VANRIVFMESGTIIADQPAREFFDNPATTRIEAFLSRLFLPRN